MKNGVFWVVTPCGSCKNLLTRATWRNNPEDTILHSHRRENLKSYTEGPLPYSQKPTAGTYLEQAEATPHPPSLIA
jgi:hypothetical protein